MASQQGYVGRIVSQLTAWLLPRPIVTLPILVLVGTGFGQLLWHFVDSVKFLSWMAGMATPFCLMCATAVWTTRERLDDAFDIEQLSSTEYQNSLKLTANHRRKSTFVASCTALMAMVSSFPTVSSQLMGPIWHWMVLCSSIAVFGSIYAYWLATSWEQQIRSFKSKQKIEAKRAREKADLIEKLSAAPAYTGSSGWVDGPDLATPTPTHH